VSKIRATPAGERQQKRRRSAEEEEEESLDRELQAITREVLDLGTDPTPLLPLLFKIVTCPTPHTRNARSHPVQEEEAEESV
jgi:hypothetical protein